MSGASPKAGFYALLIEVEERLPPDRLHWRAPHDGQPGFIEVCRHNKPGHLPVRLVTDGLTGHVVWKRDARAEVTTRSHPLDAHNRVRLARLLLAAVLATSRAKRQLLMQGESDAD